MAIRVMLVDDSAIIRELLKRALTAHVNIEIVAAAFNGAVAIALAKEHKPDIIILDIEMPEMDGLTALPKLLAVSPASTVIIASTLTLRNASISLKALELGASDYVAKPTARGPVELDRFYRELLEKIRALAGIKKPRIPPAQKKSVPSLPETRLVSPIKALAIASSTGGPQALIMFFSALKSRLKHMPIFITQHMPPNFTTILAEHISRAGEWPCHEGKDGEIVQPGQAYLAPRNFHMVVENQGEKIIIHTNQNPPENFCRPAADPMLRSLSTVYGEGLMTVVLTGMGSDGLEGAKLVIKNGGNVIAQDEATSVIWGMPRAVAKQGLCRAVLPLTEIAPYITRLAAHA